MKGTLAIVGAGGHGRVIADTAIATGWTAVDFFDDRFPAAFSAGVWPIVGTTGDLLKRHGRYGGVIVAIGENRTRLAIHESLHEGNAPLVTLVHPSAWVSPHAKIGAGSAVIAGAIVNIGTDIGPAAIINTGATIDHDCRLAEGVHVSPGAHLAGAVAIGRLAWIGIGAVIREGVNIGARTMIGAGAVVVSDIGDDIVAMGCPAKPMII